MSLTDCSNILTTTHHQKFSNQNICKKVRKPGDKHPLEKEAMTTNALKKKLQEIYKNHLNKVVDFDNRVMEEKLNKISASVFNPPEQILELFIRSVQNNSSQALNTSNFSVFWELANAYKISWLIEDCKKFMLNPTPDPEIGLSEWLKDCM